MPPQQLKLVEEAAPEPVSPELLPPPPQPLQGMPAGGPKKAEFRPHMRPQCHLLAVVSHAGQARNMLDRLGASGNLPRDLSSGLIEGPLP